MQNNSNNGINRPWCYQITNRFKSFELKTKNSSEQYLGHFLSPNKSVLWGCLNDFIWANPKRFHKTKCILLIARSKFSTCFLEAKICVWEVSRGGRLVKDFLLWERRDDTLPFILLTINRESYFSTTFAKICLQNIK